MSEWSECKLRDVCHYVRDRRSADGLTVENYISTENLIPNKGGYTTANSVPEGVQVTEFHVGDVLVSNIRPYFKKIWQATFDSGCSNDVLVFRAHDGIDSRWLNFVIANDRFFDHCMAGAKGCKMPRGDKQQIMEYPINLPDLPTQRKIAAVLGALDDKIELNRKMNANLEAMAQALFKSWFVDFEPFGGQMPEGWRMGKLNELITVCYGKDHKKLADGKFPVYGSGGIMRYAEKPLFESESVLIPRKGTLNNIMYVDRPFWTVDTMFYSKMVRANVAKYVYLFLSRKDMEALNAGSAVPSMTTEILNDMDVVIPDDGRLQEFDSVVSVLFQKKFANEDQNKTLAQLRDTLLPKLMSGELNVDGVKLEPSPGLRLSASPRETIGTGGDLTRSCGGAEMIREE